MQRMLTILGALLVGQLVLAAGLHFSGGDAAKASGEPLAEFSVDQVQSVEITGADEQSVAIERGGDGWRLPGSDGFPAKKGDVKDLLETLNGFKDRLPVARSKAARERFGVAQGKFERRVRVMGKNGPVATVYFGQSAGPDRVYARAKGSATIYEVGFALRNAKVSATAWFDSDVAGVKMADVMEVRLPGYRIRRGNGGNPWLVLPDGGMVEPGARGKVVQFMQRLVGPELKRVAKKEAPQGKPKLSYTVTQREGGQVRFDYYATGKKGGDVYLHRSDQPWRYTVANQELTKILNQSPDKLTQAQSSAGAGKASGGAGGSSGR